MKCLKIKQYFKNKIKIINAWQIIAALKELAYVKDKASKF